MADLGASGGPRDPDPARSGSPSGPPLNFAALGELLRRPGLRVIRDPERSRLLSRWEDIVECERCLDDRLYLGIIGGTGVGKSTIINAIAGAVISRAGDRRPTTNRVVSYRHSRSTLPADFPFEDLAEPEAIHDQAELERTVVLDFPDFDSVEADHAAILRRFIPRLDVFLVLVDDEKYGDLRLFEILRALPQAAKNLHFVLNKVDLLAERYGVRWPRVAQEILADLKAKLAAHGGLGAEAPWLAAVSARAALERRLGSSPAERKDGEPVRPEGDFGAVLDLLSRYRAEKLRRGAKEANLEARKAALAREARAIGLDPRADDRAEALRQAIIRRAEELTEVLAGIRLEALGPREMRLYAGALERSARSLALPLRGIIPFFRGRSRGGALPVEEVTGMVRSHYRAHHDALRVAERELSAAVAELAGPVEPPSAPPPPAKFPALPPLTPPRVPPEENGRTLLARIDSRLARALRRGRLRAHFLPFLIIALTSWFLLQPAAARVVESLQKGEAVTWSQVGLDLLWSAVKAASPVGVICFIVALIGAYALAALLDWRRIRRAVDGAALEFEEGLHEEASREAAALFRKLAVPLVEWQEERGELARALG